MAKLDRATEELVTDFLALWDKDHTAQDWEIREKLTELGLTERSDIEDLMGIQEASKILREGSPELGRIDKDYILAQIRMKLDLLNSD